MDMKRRANLPKNDLARAYIAYSLFVAILAIFLAVALLLSSTVAGCEWRGSLSAYYHGSDFQRNVFVGTLCAVAAFLLLYRGWRDTEARLLSVAGAAAVLVAFFPTSVETYECVAGGSTEKLDLSSGWIHGIAAAILFLCILIVGVVLPSIRNRKLEKRKKLPLHWYWSSAAMMIAGLICAVLGSVAFEGSVLFLLGEALLVVGFGWFWLLRSLHLGRIEPLSYLLTEADSLAVKDAL